LSLLGQNWCTVRMWDWIGRAFFSIDNQAIEECIMHNNVITSFDVQQICQYDG
jgi:hypothetical protein